MNFSEFKALLGADPWNRDPETLRARNAAPEFEQAAQEAEAFERKLQGAIDAPLPDSLVENLLQLDARDKPGRFPRWFAMAASVTLVAGISAMLWLQMRQPQDVQQYVQYHLAHDGEALLGRATGAADRTEVQRILAGFGVGAEPALVEQIRLIKICPTPDGRGAHMVVDMGSGPVHVIFMPETPVEDGEEFLFDGHLTHLLKLARGGAAVVGRADQPIGDIDRVLRNSLYPLQTKT